jgi:hypothetical protein
MTEWEKREIPERELWDWKAMWKRIQANIAYDPKNNPDDLLPLPPLPTRSSSPEERKPPQSVKLALQSGSSSPDSDSRQNCRRDVSMSRR